MNLLLDYIPSIPNSPILDALNIPLRPCSLELVLGKALSLGTICVLLYSLSGMDASAQTSSHEMTIPNDVRASDE